MYSNITDHAKQTESNINSIDKFIDQVKQLKAKSATMEEVINFVSQIRQTNTISFPLDPIKANSVYNVVMPYQYEWQYQQEFLIRRFSHYHLQNYYTERLIHALAIKDGDDIHSTLTFPYSADVIVSMYGRKNIIKLLDEFEECINKYCLPECLIMIANHLPAGIEVLIDEDDTIITKRINIIRNRMKDKTKFNKLRALFENNNSTDDFVKRFLVLTNQFKLCDKFLKHG